MNANKQDVGGLPELPGCIIDFCRDLPPRRAEDLCTYIRYYGELCRAAPAGGDRDPLPTHHCQNGRSDICLAANYDGVCCPDDSCDIDDGVRDPRPDSAPAGSGEVLSVYSLNRVIDRVEGEAQWNDWSQGRILTELRNYIRAQATVIPDPQSMGDDEVDNIESYATALERMSLCNSRTADGANLSQAARFIHEYAALLRKLQQGADGWIAASERLPERIEGTAHSADVLVSDGKRVWIHCAYFDWKACERDYWGDTPYVPRLGSGATHWRPLPHASQGQEGGANG